MLQSVYHGTQRALTARTSLHLRHIHIHTAALDYPASAVPTLVPLARAVSGAISRHLPAFHPSRGHARPLTNGSHSGSNNPGDRAGASRTLTHSFILKTCIWLRSTSRRANGKPSGYELLDAFQTHLACELRSIQSHFAILKPEHNILSAEFGRPLPEETTLRCR